MRVTKVKLTDEQVGERLRAFEAKYGMDSAAFYKKYSRGEMDDRRDFVRWAGLWNMQAASRASDSIRV